MSVSTIIGLLVLGLFAGMMSSMVGIGGGVIIVPVLVFIFAMSQKTAQGTSLVMLLPPIGILGVIQYYKSGYVDFKVAIILCVAFIAGSYFGSLIAIKLPDAVLKRVFGVFMMVIALKYLIGDKNLNQIFSR